MKMKMKINLNITLIIVALVLFIILPMKYIFGIVVIMALLAAWLLYTTK